MRARFWLLFICFVAIPATASGCGFSLTSRAGPELLTAADRSFSEFPFGSREAPAGLTIVKRADCEKSGECAYRDPAGVEHYFWDGELVVKTVQVADAGRQSISALTIGHSRAFDDVMRRVRTFLPEADIDCRAQDDERTCSAVLGEGWITLQFNDAGRLTEVRIDAYHFA